MGATPYSILVSALFFILLLLLYFPLLILLLLLLLYLLLLLHHLLLLLLLLLLLYFPILFLFPTNDMISLLFLLLQVHRSNKWIRLLSNQLLPGDIVSIGEEGEEEEEEYTNLNGEVK